MGTIGRFREVFPEECCFECKDGGEDLRVCDKENCFKSYHSECTVRGFPPPGEQFICNWHTCVDCRKSSDNQCLCCPNFSVCRDCLGKVEFFKVGKQNKGLCVSCIGLAITTERHAVHREAKCMEQEIEDISVILFKDYWDEIKEKEHLTLVDLLEASGFRRDLGLYCSCEANAEEVPDLNHKSDTPDSLLYPPVTKAQGVAECASESFEVQRENPPEGAINQLTDSSGVREEESPKAGEALSSGVTPDSLLHPAVNKVQDDSKTQAIDVDKDESHRTKRHKGSEIPVHGVINLDSSDEEEDVHDPERVMMPPPGLNGDRLHKKQLESSARAALHAYSQGALHRLRLRHGAATACPCALKWISPSRPMWYYADPQGNSRGPFPLIKLWEWNKEGYFDESFKVWRVGLTKNEAILLIDAFRIIL